MHCEGNFSYTSCLFIVALVSSGLEPVDSFQGFETLLQASGSDDFYGVAIPNAWMIGLRW